MNQIANIFRKDLRHYWREIVVLLALMAGYACAQISESNTSSKATGLAALASGYVLFEILLSLIVPLVPISWMFLTVRAVHGESLVGDRQFWVTRPYDWKKLLTTKIAFVLAFVNVPLFLLQVFLLAKAGFHPTSYLIGLLWMQMFWILLILLPTAALATVTSSIGQMLLAILFVALYFISIATLASAVPNSSFLDDIGPVYLLLLVGTAIVVTLLQYSRRKTAIARWLIVGLGALVALIMVLTPYRILILHEYPLVDTSSLPLRVSLQPAYPPEHVMNMGDVVPIRFPVLLSGLPSDAFIDVNGLMLTLTSANGGHWESGWEPRGMLWFSDQKSAAIEVYLKKPVFEKFKSEAISGQLLIAFTVFHDQNQRPLVIPSEEFSLPDVGLCSAAVDVSSPLRCRVPLHAPKFLLVTSPVDANTCPLPKGQARPEPGHTARGTLRGGEGPADPGISPISDVSISLQANSVPFVGICPGTPVILSSPEQTQRARLEIPFDNISLPAHLQGTDQANR